MPVRVLSARRSPGFTLIELLAAATVTALIGSAAAALLIEAARVRGGAAVRADLGEEAARAVEQVIRYVREIEQDTALSGLAQIASADAEALAFGTTAIRRNASDVELSDDGQLSWRPLVRDASALTFRYYTAAGVELTPVPLSAAQRQAVRQVAVELRLARGGESVRLRTRVYLRSFLNEAGT